MPADAPLNAWSSFYITTGSSAAALTGLMFVVITLVYNRIRPGDATDGIGTFSTPNVLHFCSALFLSAVMLVPWEAFSHARIIVTLCGLFGIAYGARIAYKTIRREMTSYTPDLEDLTWYGVLPIIAYVIAAVAGAFVPAPQAPFVLGAAVMLLIFIGIRNAWDVVTFLAINPLNEDDDSK